VDGHFARAGEVWSETDMAYDLLNKQVTGRDWSCGGFSNDAQKAIKASPGYFVKWYTIKSVGLGFVGAGLAFMLGRASVGHKKCG